MAKRKHRNNMAVPQSKDGRQGKAKDTTQTITRKTSVIADLNQQRINRLMNELEQLNNVHTTGQDRRPRNG